MFVKLGAARRMKVLQEVERETLSVEEIDDYPIQTAPRRKRRGVIWKTALLAIFVAVGAWLAFTTSGRDFAQTAPGAAKTLFVLKQNPDVLFNNVGDSRVNILLVGEDYNWTIKPVLNPRTGKTAPYQVVDTASPPRADTLIVFSFDRERRTVRMLSLPRDARVTYSDLEGTLHERRKLNSVYSSGGLDPQKRQELMIRVLREEFGLRVDRVAVIKPNSFKKLVDMVGGVYVNVDGALRRDPDTGKTYHGPIAYRDNWAGWEVNLKPGAQWLNGEKAHGYVRFRKDLEGDPGRIRRQQDVMKALARRVMSKPLFEIPGMVQEVRRQFRTDMNDIELGSAALFAKNLGSAEKIQPLTLFGRYASNGDIVLNGPKNEKLMAAIFGTTFNSHNFLVRSPSTRRDDIGPHNNAGPGALEVLKEAGLLPEGRREASALGARARRQ